MSNYLSKSPFKEETVKQYVVRQVDILRRSHEVSKKTPYVLTEVDKSKIQQNVVKYFGRPHIMNNDDLKSFTKDILEGKYPSSPLAILADEIEFFMYSRDEYDVPKADRIRWIAPVLERNDRYREADSMTLERCVAERAAVRYLIYRVLDGTANHELGGISPLMDYFSDQKAEMFDDNDLLFSAGRIYQQLCELTAASMGRA